MAAVAADVPCSSQREALRGAGAVCLFNHVARAARVC